MRFELRFYDGNRLFTTWTSQVYTNREVVKKVAEEMLKKNQQRFFGRVELVWI